MKKTVAILLALVMTWSMGSALAAGNLQVEQENFHVTTDDQITYYNLYAKVTNVGDELINIAGSFEVYDEKGNTIGSSDFVNAFPQFLQPGEYGYVAFRDSRDTAQAGQAADHKLTITDVPAMFPLVAHRLPCTFSCEEGAGMKIIVATVTNDLEKELFNIQVVFAALDAEGNILSIDLGIVRDESVMPGSSTRAIMPVDSNLTPASFDVFAYVDVPKQ